eukprot:10440995-Ditylum_brightwellii.AAC.1
MPQAKGESAKKRIVWWRLNMIECMVNSYCGILNNKESLEHVKDYHELGTAREEDRKQENVDKAEQKKQKEIEKERKETERVYNDPRVNTKGNKKDKLADFL